MGDRKPGYNMPPPILSPVTTGSIDFVTQSSGYTDLRYRVGSVHHSLSSIAHVRGLQARLANARMQKAGSTKPAKDDNLPHQLKT